MVVRRGCSGTDIPVVYLHSLSKQVHSVHVSIVTYFRPGAQNCNLYDYYMINILNVIVVRCSFERSISKVDVFLFASLTVIQTVCITNSLSLLCYRYLFSNLQRKQSSMNCSFCFALRIVYVCPGLVPRDSCAVLSLRQSYWLQISSISNSAKITSK